MFSDNKKAYVDYGFDVCTAVLNLADMQKERLKQEELDNVFYNVEIPLIIVMASMEYEGFKVDKNVLRQFGHVMAEKIDEISGKSFSIGRRDF